MAKKKTYCVTANVKGWFYIKAKSREEARENFREMVGKTQAQSEAGFGFDHFTIEKINGRIKVDKIPF